MILLTAAAVDAIPRPGLGGMRAAFNRERGKVRVLSIVSPR